MHTTKKVSIAAVIVERVFQSCEGKTKQEKSNCSI